MREILGPPEAYWRTAQERAFLAYVRRYAALGSGWMPQVIEAEWPSHVLSRGEPDASWGPAYFTQELARMEQQGKEESRHE